MEIRVSGSGNAKQALIEAAVNLGKLKEVRHANNFLTDDARQIFPRTIFVFEKDEVIVFDSFTNGYVGAGPNCLYESLVHFGVEDDKAKDLAYEPVTEFVASFEA